MEKFKKKRTTIQCLDPGKAYADVYQAGAEAAKRHMEGKVRKSEITLPFHKYQSIVSISMAIKRAFCPERGPYHLAKCFALAHCPAM